MAAVARCCIPALWLRSPRSGKRKKVSWLEAVSGEAGQSSAPGSGAGICGVREPRSALCPGTCRAPRQAVMLTAASPAGTGLLQGEGEEPALRIHQSPRTCTAMEQIWARHQENHQGKGMSQCLPKVPPRRIFGTRLEIASTPDSQRAGTKKLQSQLQRWPRFGGEGSGCKHKQARD